MTKIGVFLIIVAVGLPTSLWGQGKPAVSTAEPVIVTAPPPKAPSPPQPPPKVVNESIISRRSEKEVSTVVNHLRSLGSNVPVVIVYYKGFAYVRGSLEEIPVDVVPYKGNAYAILHMPGLPGFHGNLEVVKLGVYKE